MSPKANGSGALWRIIERACAEHGSHLKDLTVLAPQNDPYRLDIPPRHRDGAWIAKQLARTYGATKRAHWRGLHYAIVAKGNIKKPNGAIYRNTHNDWMWLVERAGKAARWLGYVPFDRITDERNSAPIIHRTEKTFAHRWLSIGIEVEIPDVDDLDPVPVAAGFDVRHAFHFVFFGEKSSLEDVALPIAETYEVDLYLPSGEISDTLLYQIAKDGAEDGRPMIVFTLSDCDPSGYQMPVSIGRKLQAFRDFLFPNLRFEIVPVALLPEQVRTIRPKLPETPMKKSELRADRWREEFGVDQTEIDALTTPDKAHILSELIEQAIAPYIDQTLHARVKEARDKWYEDALEALSEQIDEDQLEEIRAEAAEKLEELSAEVDNLNEKLKITAGGFTLPKVIVPEAKVDLDPERQALVSFDDDWVEATKALKQRKSYGQDDGDSS